ncbi:SMI1/KNR4 family protein [Pseudochryseolinea flava]|nr:SMI1/KNR4 family protein [Pseudochryseolinea flava]
MQFSSKESIEAKMGFALPADYVFFLSNYAGHESFLKENYFVLWDEAELLSLNEGYEVQHYLANTLAIGSNGGGEMIALQHCEDHRFQIILIPFGSMREKEIVIGDSFTDFLKRMNDGRKWFD